MSDEPTHTTSSGNPYADLGMPDADLRLAKARLAQRITATVDERGLTVDQAAATMEIDPGQLSRISRGQLNDFPLEWLLELARRLDMDIAITVFPNPEPARAARMVVITPELAASVDR